MSKYINADRLIQHLSDWRFGDNLEAFPCNELIEAIESSPAADVVEVVRCKDCKHNVINHGRYCIFGDCSGCLVADDFFCKYGERKDDD